MISSCVYIEQCSFIHYITEESICGGEMRDMLRGIPCGATQLCQLQTTVGLCTCTLGWGSAVKNGHGPSSACLYVTYYIEQ